jgi:hypothetical protein
MHRLSLIVQTTGGGTSRTVAECLHRRWGLYFTCASDTGTVSGIGSTDLRAAVMSVALQVQYHNLRGREDDLDRRLSENRRLAQRQALLALKARFVFLRFFLEVGAALGLPEPHLRARWAQLQLCPQLLTGTDDFRELVAQLTCASGDYLTSWITEWQTISAALKFPLGASPWVIVDEAQESSPVL